MAWISLGCQVCLTTFQRVGILKGHMDSQAHRKKSKDVFKQDITKGYGVFPSIRLINQWSKGDIKQPITGLTLCFSLKSPGSFYLCQVCEEMCSSHKILDHLSTVDHCRNHFSQTNPNALRFSWIPGMDVGGVSRPEVTKKIKESGGGQLQVLDLPGGLWDKLETSTYSEVMRTLSKNEKLLELLEVVKPKQMMIQTYQRDSNREHPLLGMQHIVECICVGQTEKRHYLCTLCHLTLAAHMIVKHVLSFDHIFCYFRAWHPSTLLVKEFYKDYTPVFASMMLDLAKQTEQIHGTAEMTQVRMEPAKFKSVNFTCYADALKELESIRKGNKESSLIVNVTPGKKLDLMKPESKEKEKEESRLITSVTPEKKLALTKPESIGKENEENHLITSVTPGNKLVEFRSAYYKLRCQNCSMSFLNMPQYCKHLSNDTHKRQVKQFFGGGSICFPPFSTGADSSDRAEWKPSLELYKNLVKRSKQNHPFVGVPLVVACVCTQVQEEPIYMCFACQDCFTESFLRQHFDSQKHLIRTLLYQNPWRLTLGWKHRLDEKHLRSMAREEEEEKPHQRMLKVLDMPNGMFQRLVLSLNFKEVMKSLTLQHIILMRDVPPDETYRKLKENDRFPLLGRQFLVMYDVCFGEQQPTVAFLCLLCERKLSDEECYAHEFSRKHIATYLDRFHPGSLDSSTDDESFLDLAKQAARYHTISHVQVMKLKRPIIQPCSYTCALFILTSAERDGHTLNPIIIPKMKLVPRKKMINEDKDHVRDNIQENASMECLETTSQTSTDNRTLKKTVEVDAEVTDTYALKSEEDAEKGDDKDTLSLFPLTSEKGRVAFSQTSPEDVQQSETCQTMKEEKIEILTSGEPAENGQNEDKNGIRNERNKSSEVVLTQMTEISPEDTCSVEDEGQEKNREQQRLTFTETPQNLSISGQRELTTLDKGESGKLSHKTAKDEASSKADQQQVDQLWQYLKRKCREPVVGLSELLECSSAEHDPIYLCKCCCATIPEKDIISHVTGVEHQKMYLVGLKKIPPPPGMNQGKTMRHFAGLFEREHGYGEAEIVELDDEMYNNLSKHDFDSVLQTVKALQDQQDSGCELPSTSALPGVQPVDTIVPLQSQHEVCFMKGNYQVIKMETDDSEDLSSVTMSMSLETETTSNTTKVRPESNEAHVKVSQTPGPSPNTLSKRTGDKVEIISNTTVAPFKIEATYKVVGGSESVASSDSTETIPTKSMTAISEFTTKSSNSTPDTAFKYKATTSTSCDTISRTTSTTTSVTVSKTLQSRTRAATEVRTASCKAAGPSKAESTVVFDAAGRTSPGFTTETTSNKTQVPPESNKAHSKASKAPGTSTNTLSKSSEDKDNISSNATVAPFKIAATSKVVGRSETAASSDSTVTIPTKSMTAISEFTTKSSNSTPDATKSTAPITTSKYTATTSSSSDTISRTTSTTTSVTVSKTLESRTRAATEVRTASCKAAGPSQAESTVVPSRSSPKVGLNQLIKVSCGQRKQVYCKLCSVRLLKSEHTGSATHQLNYVKMKYPQWTCKPSELESKLQEVVKNLAEVERPVGSPSFPTVKVTIDVYKELADLSAEKALERLKAMLERGFGVSSPTISNPGGFLRRQISGANQHEYSSPDYGIESSPKVEGSLAVGQCHRTQSVESSEPEANDQIRDQLTSCSSLNNNEPLASPCIQDVGVAAAKMERPRGCAPPPATDAQTPGSKETLGWKRQQERSPPEIQDTRKVLEGSQRTSPVKFFNPDQLFSAATVTTKKQDQPRPSQKAENELPMVLLGESTEGCSHLSIFLKVTGADREPIIGMDFVWECRGLSSKTFFLCESCEVTLPSNVICQHMISQDHQIKFLLSQKSEFMYFWPESYQLPHPDVYLEKWMKLEIVTVIAKCLSLQERDAKTNAKLILLVPELYEHVRTAPFSKALEIVKNIKKEQKLSVSFQPSSTAQRKVQLPEAQHSPEESLSMEMQPALQTNRRSDDEPPDPRRSVSPHQRPIQELPVKPTGVHPESTSFAVCPRTLSESSSDQHLPTRKRVMSYCTDQPDLEDPMPAKRKPKYDELQPIIQPSPESVSESTSVNPAATSVPLSPQNEDLAPGSDEEEDIPMAHLIALVKQRKSALNASRRSAALGNGETTISCANTSLKSQAQRRRDSTSVQTTPEMAMKRKRWDENFKMVRETNDSDPAYALEEKFNSSFDGSLARGDLLFGATEAKAVGTMLPYASTADQSDPQRQSINTRTTFGDTNQSNPNPTNCAFINSNLGHIPQPRDYTENDSTGARQLPINAIVSVRSNQPQQQFIGGNNELDLVEVNGGETVSDQTPPGLVTCRFSSAPEICPGNVLGGYGQDNQMVYVTNRQSGYFASEAVGSYATPGHPPVHTGSSFQFEGCPTGRLHFPSQIHPHQETTCQSLPYFGNNLPPEMPPEWMRVVYLSPPAANTQVMSQAFANSFYASGDEI